MLGGERARAWGRAYLEQYPEGRFREAARRAMSPR
jgi:hypothetical protein